jgi:hypothetical protein
MSLYRQDGETQHMIKNGAGLQSQVRDTGAAEALCGVRFRSRNRVGPIRWSTNCMVVVAEPPRHLAFDARHWTGATKDV